MAKKQKLKIGYVFDDSLDRNDGVQQYIKVVGNWMAEQGHTVHYFVGETKDAKGYKGKVHSLSRNISVRGNQNRLSIPTPASTSKIQDLLHNLKPDVLHVQMPFSPFMGAKVINQADYRTAVLATFHIIGEGFTQRYGARALSIATNRATRRIDQVVAVSEPASSYASKYYGVDSIVIPNAVNLDLFKSSKKQRNSRPTILFLGRLVQRKGVHHLLAAVANSRAELKYLNARVLIAGDGPLRPQLDSLVEEFNLGDMVHFLGYIEEKTKADLIASADLAVYPATGGESFGIVLIEAMATNGPVVLAGDNPGYTSVIGEQFQQLIDPNDDVALGKRIVSLLEDKKLRTQLKRWQNKRVRQFDIKTVGPQLEKQYKQLSKDRLAMEKNIVHTSKH